MKRPFSLLGRLILAPISWRPLSRLYGRIMRLQRPRRLAQWLIARFHRHYRIDMGEFQGKPEDYGSLAEFFLRPLDAAKRPLPGDESRLLSPADGRLSGLELIEGDAATQVKGWTYPLSLLLAEEPEPPRRWHVATIYLSPRNYHRFHYPVAGRITGCFFGGTRLFPVNGFSVNRVRRLYVRNERAVTRFALHDRPLYMVAVGATFVGNIALNYLACGRPAPGIWHPCDIEVRQMDEMGHFALGSTIVLVVPADRVVETLVEEGALLRVGQPLFKIRI